MLHHIAFIMDGNGRWATSRGLSRSQGHLEGYKKLLEICDECYRYGVSVVSVYALSFDNRVKRPKQEIHYLYNLLLDNLTELTANLQRNNIEFKWSGSPEGLPDNVVKKLHDLEKYQIPSTEGKIFNFAFNYSGKREIFEAVKTVVNSVDSIDQINADLFASCLYNGELGDIDLLIRTGKEKRISDFFLWQVGNSQLLFLDMFWPEITKELVVSIIESL